MKKAWTGGIRGVLEPDDLIRPTHRLPVYVNVAMKQIDLFGVYNCCPSGDNLFVDPPASQPAVTWIIPLLRAITYETY